MFKKLLKILGLLAISLVVIYRFFISPILPCCCRYRPTCSEYMIDAVKIHGIIRGLFLGIKRILRCHPFAKNNSGYDPVKRI